MGQRLAPQLNLSSSISVALVAALALVSSACEAPKFESVSPTTAGISAGPEPDSCSPIAPISNPVSVTGNAIYYYRATSLSQTPSTNNGLYGNPVSTNIRYAETAIYNASGSLVQCGQTDGSGNFSLQVPKVAGNYTVRVYSRSLASSSLVRASVLEDIYGSSPYYISGSFTVASSSVSIAAGTLSAKARVSESAKIEGGAFFILDQILSVNERMRSISGDASFLAPKVQVYWKAGFNPYSYFGYPNTLASFYVNGERKLYILGGKNGDVKSSDTDHFDASVIVHEYGHFIEDTFGKSESPGGSHAGVYMIDPRLAWSEGWSNYYQAEMLNGRYFTKGLYVDTIGFKGDSVEGGSASGSGIAVKFDLSTDGATSLYDSVSVSGEGTFREISVSRGLYKTTKSPASSSSGAKGAAVPFDSIWNSFKSTVQGFGTSASVVFRSTSYFNEFLYNDINTRYPASLSGWLSNVVADERQSTNRKDFGDVVSRAGSCGAYPRALSPVIDSDFSGYYHSNPLLSNDFYSFYYDGSGSQLVSMSYSNSGLKTIDLDLIVWKRDFRIIEDEQEYIQGASNSFYAVRSRRLNPSIESGYESVSLSGLSAGYYLINVKAVTINRSTGVALTNSDLNGTAHYTLQLTTNGTTTEYLCPAH